MMNLKAPKIQNFYIKVSKNQIQISFGALFKYNEEVTIKCSNYHKIYRQPELFESAFNATYNLKDFLIWNKIIKREIYLKAYEIFKEKIYGEKWNYHEDNIWSILVNKYAKSMRCINKLIYIYNDLNDSLTTNEYPKSIQIIFLSIKNLMKNRYNELELKNIIYRHQMYKELFISKRDKKYLIAEHLEIIK